MKKSSSILTITLLVLIVILNCTMMNTSVYAEESGLEVEVCHFPPGTSKWNKIEHRLFSQITKNWRGRPLGMLEIIVNLIASTTTDNGLVVRCKADTAIYPKGTKISDKEFAGINLLRNEFHPDWNYVIGPSDR